MGRHRGRSGSKEENGQNTEGQGEAVRNGNVQTKKDQYIYRNLGSVFIIAVMALFLFLLRYDVPLYGDDVGGLVSNNPDSTYVDDRVVEGECVLNLDYSLSESWDRLCYSYIMWNGRVATKLVTPLVRLIFSLPDGINWVLFSLYITGFLLGLLLMTVYIICGNIKEGMRNPAIILLTGTILFYIPCYSYAYMTRLIMYTFTNIYVVSVILYLAFYGAIRRVYLRHNDLCAKTGYLTDTRMKDAQLPGGMVTVSGLVGINILGLLAGLSHEAYGVIFGMVLLTQLVRFWFENHRKISIRYLFMYIGYIIGFCICFFAPGNFNRAQQSHESTLRTVPLIRRLFNSIYIHVFVAYKFWIVPVIVLPILVIIVVVLFRKRILTVKDILKAVLNNLEWFFGFAMSAVTWGLVARVVNYGMLAANVLLIIGVIRVFRELWMIMEERHTIFDGQCDRTQIILTGVSIAVVIAMAAGNYADMSEVHQIANEWRENLSVARKVGMEEIIVPAYPEDLDPRFYDLRIINGQERYDKIACRVVYGTHVILDSR